MIIHWNGLYPASSSEGIGGVWNGLVGYSTTPTPPTPTPTVTGIGYRFELSPITTSYTFSGIRTSYSLDIIRGDYKFSPKH